MTNQDIAAKLAAELREIADAVEKAGEGDKEARSFVSDHVDSYWHALVIGRGEVQQLLSDEEEEFVMPDGGSYGTENPGFVE